MAAITTSPSPTTAYPIGATLDAADGANTDTDADPSLNMATGPTGSGDGAAAKAEASLFARHDLHPAVQAFVRPSTGETGEAPGGRIGPGQDPWAGRPDVAAPLYQRQQVPVGQTPPVAKAPVRLPPPADMATMDRLSTTIRTFKPGNSPFPDAELIDAQRGIARATRALHDGDYKTAAAEFEKLGFPLPDGQVPSHTASLVAHMLGSPTNRANGTITVEMNTGPHGSQPLNDLNGYAANARMMSRFAEVPGVTNPPSEAQVMAFMKAAPAVLAFLKHPDRTAEIMKLASEITEGMIAHYSETPGGTDPTYGANPNPRFVARDADGTVHDYASQADAARDGHPRATAMVSHSPDEWSDIASIRGYGGRLVGDCESKLYLQTRLLTAAGFTSLGSVDVQPPSGTGHMLGVFKAPDGSVWVTSNQDFTRVHGTGPGGSVTQIDVEGALRDVTADVYDIKPNARGQRDTSRFVISVAATSNQSGPNAATDTLRRATELNRMGRSEAIVVDAAPPQAAGPRRTP